jgi:hypothetical protein
METKSPVAPGVTESVVSSATTPPVKSIADSLAANTPKRGRGRPPKAKPVSQNPPGNQAQVANDVEAPTAEPGSQIDIALVKKTVESVIGAIDGAIIRKVHRVAYLASKDEGLAKEFATTAAITKDEMEVVSTCAGVICQKYNVMGQYAPEAMLLAVIAGYSIRVVVTFRKLNTIIEAQAAALRKANAAKPSA